jgi:hypothetical protein
MASPSNEQGVMSRAQAMNLMLNLNLAQYRLIMIDTKNCARCNVISNVTYFCKHTGLRDMCTECYQYIHWICTTDMVKNEE